MTGVLPLPEWNQLRRRKRAIPSDWQHVENVCLLENVNHLSDQTGLTGARWPFKDCQTTGALHCGLAEFCHPRNDVIAIAETEKIVIDRFRYVVDWVRLEI